MTIVDDHAPVDVTLTGAVETLTAATDPALVGELGASGSLLVEGEPRAVRRVGKLFEAPRVRG